MGKGARKFICESGRLIYRIPVDHARRSEHDGVYVAVRVAQQSDPIGALAAGTGLLYHFSHDPVP